MLAPQPLPPDAPVRRNLGWGGGRGLCRRSSRGSHGLHEHLSGPGHFPLTARPLRDGFVTVSPSDRRAQLIGLTCECRDLNRKPVLEGAKITGLPNPPPEFPEQEKNQQDR